MGKPHKRISFKEFVRPIPHMFLNGILSPPRPGAPASVTRIRDQEHHCEIVITVRGLNEQ